LHLLLTVEDLIAKKQYKNRQTPEELGAKVSKITLQIFFS